MAILNICVKYASDIKDYNLSLRKEANANHNILGILDNQKKSTEEYLLALLDSKKIVINLHLYKRNIKDKKTL